MARALLPTGHADAEEADALVAQILEAPLAVGVERVAALEDGVALFEMRQQLLDHLVNRLAGLDHDDDRARTLHGLDELDQIGLRHDLAVEALLLRHADEIVDARRGAVMDRDRVTVVGNVECKVRAHDCEPDEADIGGGHVHSPLGVIHFRGGFVAWAWQEGYPSEPHHWTREGAALAVYQMRSNPIVSPRLTMGGAST